jgi:hypothetical protein
MNAKSNARGTMTAITHLNATGAMHRIYHELITNAGHIADKVVMNNEENKSGERLKIQAVPLLRYKG